MNNEPGAAILAVFDQLINNVKQARPVRSDGKPLGGGVVYSMMTLGMPVDPEDYLHPWSPMGGATLQDMAGKGTLPNMGAAPAASTPGGAGAASTGTGSTTSTAPAPQTPDPKIARAMQAAYKTAQLCNLLLQVRTDGTYLEYPLGRHLDFAYEGIINSMQPLPMPPISPGVQAQIDQAQKVLYDLDDDGNMTDRKSVV